MAGQLWKTSQDGSQMSQHKTGVSGLLWGSGGVKTNRGLAIRTVAGGHEMVSRRKRLAVR